MCARPELHQRLIIANAFQRYPVLRRRSLDYSTQRDEVPILRNPVGAKLPRLAQAGIRIESREAIEGLKAANSVRILTYRQSLPLCCTLFRHCCWPLDSLKEDP